MRPYRKPSGAFLGLPVAQSVHQGGWGAWELGLRFSSIDLTDGDIDGGEMGRGSRASRVVRWWLWVGSNHRPQHYEGRYQ